MTLPFPISSNQTKAKAPIDQNLMDSIRLNLNDLSLAITGQNAVFSFNVNGLINQSMFTRGRSLDTSVYFSEFQPSTCRAILKEGGISGNLTFDLRKAREYSIPITSIISQFRSNTQSVGRLGLSISTQSVSRSVAQINTQSIEYAKNQLDIQSIIEIRSGVFKINFSGPLLDGDYQAGKSISIDGTNDAANEGVFEIIEVNNSNFPSLVIENASGVAQLAAGGTVDLMLFSYNYLNPLDNDFNIGENALFSGHSDANNNGLFEIHRLNVLGANVWVYNNSGFEQVGIAGTLDVERWVYSYSSVVDSDGFVIDETALMTSHSSVDNNGNFKIVDVNRSGNNIVVYNPNGGASQAGAGGSAASNRFVYDLATNPTGSVEIDDEIVFSGHTSIENDGIFKVKIINLDSNNNLVIFNEEGATQAGIEGEAFHTKKIVSFLDDQSDNFEVNESLIEIEGAAVLDYNHDSSKMPYLVKETNRGGGSNYNVVIDGQDIDDQRSPAGYLSQEMRSIFVTPPTVAMSPYGLSAQKIVRIQNSNFKAGTVETDDTLFLYILDSPTGNPRDLTVILN